MNNCDTISHVFILLFLKILLLNFTVCRPSVPNLSADQFIRIIPTDRSIPLSNRSRNKVIDHELWDFRSKFWSITTLDCSEFWNQLVASILLNNWSCTESRSEIIIPRGTSVSNNDFVHSSSRMMNMKWKTNISWATWMLEARKDNLVEVDGIRTSRIYWIPCWKML